MFFRSLCPTVMLASVHSGVVSSSFGGQSVVKKKKAEKKLEKEVEEEVAKEVLEEEDKENCGDPREKDEDRKPVPSPQTPAEDEEEDKENRPSSAGGVNKRREAGEVHRARNFGDNKLRSIPNRCLSPLAAGVQYRASPGPKRPSARTPSSPLPLRAITPLSNVQGNGRARMLPTEQRKVPTSPCLRGLRRDQPKQKASSPVKITKSALTVNPNQKLSIAYRNDRFYWVTKEVDAIKGY